MTQTNGPTKDVRIAKPLVVNFDGSSQRKITYGVGCWFQNSASKHGSQDSTFSKRFLKNWRYYLSESSPKIFTIWWLPMNLDSFGMFTIRSYYELFTSRCTTRAPYIIRYWNHQIPQEILIYIWTIENISFELMKYDQGETGSIFGIYVLYSW